MLQHLKLRANSAQHTFIVSALLKCSLPAQHLFDELCWQFNAEQEWTDLSEESESQITKGVLDFAIAELLSQGLIEVETPADFWARFNGFPVGLAA